MTHAKDDYLYPRSAYRGQFQPERLVFNANLQEFAQQVNYLCALETNGKITSQDAYTQIKALWHKLRESYQALHPEQTPPE